MLFIVKLGGIKHEELGFRTEETRVREPGEFQVTLGALCNRARIEGVTFFGDRIDGVTDETKRRLFGEGGHPEASSVGDEQHVRLVDRRPAADGRSIETKAIFELFFAEFADGKCKVLPGAG